MGHVDDKVIYKDTKSVCLGMPPYLHYYHIGTELARDDSAHGHSVISPLGRRRAAPKPRRGALSEICQELLHSGHLKGVVQVEGSREDEKGEGARY